MGIIISAIQSAIGFSTAVISEVNREKERERQKALDNLKTPIPPPYFYKTLEAREKAASGNDPPPPSYTVKGIREALTTGILPVGYSEEQLTQVGFGPEVEKYQQVILKGDLDLRHDVGGQLTSVIDLVQDGLDGVDRQSYITAGATVERMERFRDVAKRASEAKDPQEVDAGEIAAALSELQTLGGGATEQIKAGENLRKLNDEQIKASDDRTDQVLKIAQRAYLNVRRPVAPLPVGA